VVRKAAVFREKGGIDVRLGHKVTAIDTYKKTVTGKNSKGTEFALAYDRLLIATGTRPIIPDGRGFDQPGVMVVKRLDDAHRIKEYIVSKPVHKALIIGMGYIAMEMAEALRTRGIEVVMTKPRARLLPWLDGELSETVQECLTSNGVVLRTGFPIDSITSAENGLRTTGPDGEPIDADLALVAVGVQPNSEIAEAAGLSLGPGRSVAVDHRMRTSDESVYAAGDCADAFHVVTGRRTWIPLALRANRAGWAVADDITGRPVSLQGVAGTAVFKVFELQVARTGLTIDLAGQEGLAPVAVTITAPSRAHAYPGASPIQVHMVGDKRSGRLLGVQMVGKEGVAHRINAPAVALHANMTVAQFSQSDLAYAPPFGPTWDPLLVAANQLLKKM